MSVCRLSMISLIAIVALLLSACAANVPTHYYTLTQATTQTSATSPGRANFVFELQPVGIPAQVDQPQLIARVGDSSMQVLDYERWIGPLADEVRNALSARLSADLGAQDVAGQAYPAGARVLHVKVDLRRFDSLPNQYASLDAQWSLRLDDGKTGTLLCTSGKRENVGAGYAELVRGHQRALAGLARQIATTAQSLMTNAKVGCPAD